MMLVLLGQPFTRIAPLKLSDIVVDGDELNVSVAEGVVPVPPPFSTMVTELTENRPHLNTAANLTSPFLFPSTRAGKHMRPATLRLAVIDMGIDLMGARSGALRQLVLECPPANRGRRPWLRLPSDGPARPSRRFSLEFLCGPAKLGRRGAQPSGRRRRRIWAKHAVTNSPLGVLVILRFRAWRRVPDHLRLSRR